jgi:hypothetical protein
LFSDEKISAEQFWTFATISTRSGSQHFVEIEKAEQGASAIASRNSAGGKYPCSSM